ncbi:conserved hypothetical protein [Candidatus Terasakiella magnetica]|uniref:YCII-related domain-containing protein n=1 Tax=Candidatus Terasakiella magnetica TaxID=1867952 RepID=A0A1C3RFH8_9PROT|nr:YciI family protein [Candidatus Terasakiella magnetica]SCA56019.1 conserved hypothetical protein [Candidatus Terasakiella magnetica]
MAYFVVFGTDKEGVIDKRLETRPVHRQYLRDHGMEGLKVIIGGPTIDKSAEQMNGTMLVVEADTLQQVETFVANDPYCKGGVFETLLIRPWNWGLGRPEELHKD